MKNKILLCCFVLVVTTGFAADTSQAQDLSHPQVIALKDGTKLTLLGLTYGKHHVAPNSQAVGGNIWSGNSIDRTDETTVVWIEIEHDASRWPSYSLLVSDKTNTACITSHEITRCHVREGVEVHGFALNAYPRWEKDIALRIADAYGHELSKEKFVMVNLQPRSFGNEKTKPLPNTQSDGDVEVTLTKLIAGAPLEPYRRQKSISQDDPKNKCVRIAFDFKQKGQSVTNWYPWLVDISDAVGNHVQTSMQYQDNELIRQHSISMQGYALTYTYGTNDEYKGYYFLPGLWPDEPAWKVRLEFTRNSGFDDDEILTLTNLPVRSGTQKDHDEEWSWEPGQTNLFLGDYTVNGIQLKLFVPILYPSEINKGAKFISVIMRANPDPEPKGMRITLLKATDDQGRELRSPFNPTAWLNCTFDFPNDRDTKTLNLSFALHKSRFVEFTVKPTKQ